MAPYLCQSFTYQSEFLWFTPGIFVFVIMYLLPCPIFCRRWSSRICYYLWPCDLLLHNVSEKNSARLKQGIYKSLESIDSFWKEVFKQLAFHLSTLSNLRSKQVPQLEKCSSGTKWFLAGSLVAVPKICETENGRVQSFSIWQLSFSVTLARSEMHTL